ncbi:hypothetical protein BH09MYX1_BH09MYX1_38710 [soil metagenome]
MRTLVQALATQRPCPCDCQRKLTAAERTAGVAALYACDDALRGFGYAPDYELHGDALWKIAQRRADPDYRGVAVRFGECVHKRLLGSLLHESIHALSGDGTKANYGIPYGLPYGVPSEVKPSEEDAFLAKYNFDEARAFVGVWILGDALFGIRWDMRTARDVGTYGFGGGNALVSVPKGYRAVAHLDRRHHEARYYARARRLEDDARAWFDEAALAELTRRFREVAALGNAKRPTKYPPAADFGRMAPKALKSKDPCTCGSEKPYGECCARGVSVVVPDLAR